MPRTHLEELLQPEAERLLAQGRTAIVAVGSVEQHGPHLPLGTDWLAALGVAERVAELLGAPLLPLTPVGVAPYHAPWRASLTLRPETLIRLLVDVCDGLAAAGVERLLVVNWHEGNMPTLRLAADEAQRRHDRLTILVAETHLVAHELSELELTHAGALETAAVLARDPGLVALERASDPTGDEVCGPRHELFRRRDVFPVLKDFRQIAPSGWYGHPEQVSAEQAEAVFARVAEAVAERAQEVWRQLEGDRQ